MTKRMKKKSLKWYFYQAYDGWEHLWTEVVGNVCIIHADQPGACDYKTTRKEFRTRKQAEKFAKRFQKKFGI